jgi:hypothetical protein
MGSRTLGSVPVPLPDDSRYIFIEFQIWASDLQEVQFLKFKLFQIFYLVPTRVSQKYTKYPLETTHTKLKPLFLSPPCYVLLTSHLLSISLLSLFSFPLSHDPFYITNRTISDI